MTHKGSRRGLGCFINLFPLVSTHVLLTRSYTSYLRKNSPCTLLYCHWWCWNTNTGCKVLSNFCLDPSKKRQYSCSFLVLKHLPRMNDQNYHIRLFASNLFRRIMHSCLTNSICQSWCCRYDRADTTHKTANDDEFWLCGCLEKGYKRLIEGDGSKCVDVVLCQQSSKSGINCGLEIASCSRICNKDIDFLNALGFQTASQCLRTLFDFGGRGTRDREVGDD